MKQLIFGLLTLFMVNITFGQQTDKLEYCNCYDKIDQITPKLNGSYERLCNGKLIEKGNFANGLKDGEWTTYNRKGKLIRKLNYTNGQLNGKVRLFYINGKPKLTGQFDNRNKIGKWTYFTKKGRILATGSYESNRPIDIWTINNKKGKKPVVQYDFNSKKYLINKSIPIHNNGDIIQNDNTGEWYILVSPNLEYTSKTEPIGGYGFANFMFIELVEVPENYWDTFLYRKYKVSYKITNESKSTFDSQLFTESLPDNNLELTFLIKTNPVSKIKKINHSDLQKELLDYKIREALNLMPPWIYNGQEDIDLYVHYVINKNLHK